MTQVQEKIKTSFAHLNPKFDHVLAPYTYFKIGGPAEVFIVITTKQDLIALLQFCIKQKITYRLLGGASNVVVSDSGVPGVAIQTQHQDFKVLDKKVDNKQLVYADSGLKTSLLVKKCIDHNLGGLEYFLGVPGCVGGAILNNAHYLQDLIGTHVYRVEVMDKQGSVFWVRHDQCQFGYDTSRFQKTKEIILSAEFVLHQGSKQKSMELVKKATQYRAQTQPLGMPSSGCVFQNVPNNDQLRKQFPQFADKPFVPGGFLIDQAGLKGTTVGDIEVSHKHAAFFINKGKGTADDLMKLIDLVKSRVKQKFGVELQEEVFFI